jgi:hypothetical protein
MSDLISLPAVQKQWYFRAACPGACVGVHRLEFLGFLVWGLGCRVQVLKLGGRVQGSVFPVLSSLPLFSHLARLRVERPRERLPIAWCYHVRVDNISVSIGDMGLYLPPSCAKPMIFPSSMPRCMRRGSAVGVLGVSGLGVQGSGFKVGW